MKILRISFYIISALILLVIGMVFFYLQNIKPQYSGKLILSGLKDKTEVFYDTYGIPHIYANNEEDAYMTLGYAHANDRLFQMELLRRVGSGRLSEIFGNDLIDTDHFFRTLGLGLKADEAVEMFMKKDTAGWQKAALAYLSGINQYIERGKTPLEFTLLGIPKEKFTPRDLYLISGYMSFSFALGLRTDPIITRIHQKYGTAYIKDLSIETRPDEIRIPVHCNVPSEKKITSTGVVMSELLQNLPVPMLMGSNCWVIGPKKTKSGKVLLSNDTHIGYAQPCVWYEAHIEYPGFSSYGNHLAGFPFPLTGHTKHHAIGITMLENDDMDLFRERSNPDNPLQVWVNDHWENMQEREEIIKVKDRDDVVVKIRTTRHGPVMNKAVKDIGASESEPVSLWWTYHKFPAQTLQAGYCLLHATDMAEAKYAASLIHAPGLNIMYGDANGNIAWWVAAKLVKRPANIHPNMILDGASGRDEPLGYYDFSDNPQRENPPSGFVYSANNQPDTMPDGTLYPGYYVPDHRADKITKYLSSETLWDMEKTKKMITDVVSASYHNLAKEIASVIESAPGRKNISNPSGDAALKVLKSWNGEHQRGNSEPVIFYKLMFHILELSIADEMGEEDFKAFLLTHLMKHALPAHIRNDSSVWWDNVASKDCVETRSDIFLKAFKMTLYELEIQLGADVAGWKWEKVHFIEHVHPIGRKEPFDKVFNVGPYPVNGGIEVINNIGFTLTGQGIYKSKYGPAMRRIIDFSDIENSVSVLPTGQSGNVMSDHYRDQAELYNNGLFRKQMMNREEIEKSADGRVLKAGNR